MINHPREKIDLSGPWEIAFDPENEGLHSGWAGGGWPQTRTASIRVPQIWNVDFPDADGVGFYRTTFSVPPEWKDRAVLLCFEGVIYRCEIWVNGNFIGGHEGGYTPFQFDIQRLVQFGTVNTLVVRVAALSKKKVVDGMQLQHAPLSKQGWYYVYGGIWGRVTVEASPMVACHEASIDPSLDQEHANLEIEILNRWEGCRQAELGITIHDPHGETVYKQQNQITLLPGASRSTYLVPIPHPLAWSCEAPNLYRLEIQIIAEDGQVDQYLTRFGMRNFTVQDGQFFLNGKPCYIQGILLQPNFPVSLITHPDRAMMLRELTLMKQAGFNLLRTHLQPAAPEYLDLADELGMMIYAETSLAWIRDNPRLHEHGVRELQAMIDRDRNHPSIVLWGIYNENPSASAVNGEALARLARALDPTRVIVKNSGGSLAIDQDFGWIDRAEVTPAWSSQPQRILDIHLYLGSPTPGPIYQWLSDLGTGVSSRVLADEQFGSLAVVDEFDRECRSYRGQIFVSELGCGGMADLDEQVAGFGGREDLLDARELKTLRDSLNSGFQERHLERIFGSPRKLYQEAQEQQVVGNTQQVNALLTNPRVSGYMITQLNDVAWEFHAGLLDVWRNPKPAYAAACRANQPQVLVLQAARPAGTIGETVRVGLTLVSRQAPGANARIKLALVDPAQNEIEVAELACPLQPGIHPLQVIQVDLQQPGTYHVRAYLCQAGDVLADAAEEVLGLENINWQSFPHGVHPLGDLPPALSFLSQTRSSPTSVLLAALPATLRPEEVEELCLAVEKGGVAIVGALRPDHNVALNAFSRHGLALKLNLGIGSWMGCYHWAPQSDLFAGLPAGGLVKKPYTGLIPKYVLNEMGDVLAGSLRNTQSRQEAPRMLWYSDIELVQMGKGSILFCQYRVFENFSANPLAARMVHNLLTYACGLSERR